VYLKPGEVWTRKADVSKARTFREKFDIRKRFYVVYESELEAVNAKIPYVYWRKVEEAGQWVLTDGGFVVEAKAVRRMGRHRSGKPGAVEIRTAVGRAMLGQRKPFIGNTLDDDPDMRQRLKSLQAKAMITLYCSMLLNGRKIDYIRLTRVMWLNKTYSTKYVKRFIDKPVVQEMIRQELTRQLDENGFSFTEILGQYRDLIEKCKSRNDLTNFRLTLEKFVELHDALPARKNVNMNLGQGALNGGSTEGIPLLNPKDEEEAKEEMDRVLARREIDIREEGARAEVIS
jgi:hypothetical protein